eukprot:350136-Chlamydomonas_euryale.AAC.24
MSRAPAWDVHAAEGLCVASPPPRAPAPRPAPRREAPAPASRTRRILSQLMDQKSSIRRRGRRDSILSRSVSIAPDTMLLNPLPDRMGGSAAASGPEGSGRPNDAASKERTSSSPQRSSNNGKRSSAGGGRSLKQIFTDRGSTKLGSVRPATDGQGGGNGGGKEGTTNRGGTENHQGDIDMLVRGACGQETGVRGGGGMGWGWGWWWGGLHAIPSACWDGCDRRLGRSVL